MRMGRLSVSMAVTCSRHASHPRHGWCKEMMLRMAWGHPKHSCCKEMMLRMAWGHPRHGCCKEMMLRMAWGQHRWAAQQAYIICNDCADWSPILVVSLTHWGWAKMAALLRWQFEVHFLEWKCMNSNFTEVCSWGSAEHTVTQPAACDMRQTWETWPLLRSYLCGWHAVSKDTQIHSLLSVTWDRHGRHDLSLDHTSVDGMQSARTHRYTACCLWHETGMGDMTSP